MEARVRMTKTVTLHRDDLHSLVTYLGWAVDDLTPEDLGMPSGEARRVRDAIAKLEDAERA